MYTNSLGLVLNRERINDADKWLSIYTKEFGKIKALAVGANKISAKLLLVTEPLVEADFMFYTRYGKTKIVGGQIVKLFPELRTDIKRYQVACQVVEIVDLLVSERLKNLEKYQLIIRTLDLLSTKTNYRRIYLAFLVRFLKLSGYGLELDRCIKCHKVGAGYVFSLKDHGLVCNSCYQKNGRPNKIESDVVEYFRKLVKFSGDMIDQTHFPAAIEEFISGQCERYLLEYLPRPLKSNFNL